MATCRRFNARQSVRRSNISLDEEPPHCPMMLDSRRTGAYAVVTPIAQTVNICTAWHDGVNRSRARSRCAELSARWVRRRVPVFEVALWRKARVIINFGSGHCDPEFKIYPGKLNLSFLYRKRNAFVLSRSALLRFERTQ